MTPTPPNLVEAAKAISERTSPFISALEGDHDADCEQLYEALQAALAALPSDAVVVSRAVVEEAAIWIESAEPGRLARVCADKLREACR